jgi:hypothetical protein
MAVTQAAQERLVPLGRIRVPENVRELDASHVDALAGSIALQGMLVRPSAESSTTESSRRQRSGCSPFVHAEASADASPARRAAGRPCDQPSTPAADQPLAPRAFRRRS